MDTLKLRDIKKILEDAFFDLGFNNESVYDGYFEHNDIDITIKKIYRKLNEVSSMETVFKCSVCSKEIPMNICDECWKAAHKKLEEQEAK